MGVRSVWLLLLARLFETGLWTIERSLPGLLPVPADLSVNYAAGCDCHCTCPEIKWDSLAW